MGRYKQLGGSKSPCMKNLPDCSADTLHGKKKKQTNNPQGNPQSKWALGAFNLILKKWIMELCWQCWEGCFQRWLRWLLLESPAMSRTSTTGNGRFPECWWKETERERGGFYSKISNWIIFSKCLLSGPLLNRKTQSPTVAGGKDRGMG